MRMGLRSATLGVWVLAAVAGCGDDDAGTDAGPVPVDAALRDAALARDAGSAADAGGSDAAEAVDGSASIDAGSGLDAAPELDAAMGAPCRAPADCQDGVFCNGFEACAPGTAGADARGCLAGTPPCLDACDEAAFACAPAFCDAHCRSDASCDDGRACDGTETCSAAGTCARGTPVRCSGGAICFDPAGTCGCASDAACSDGRYCNGTERCVRGVCAAGTAPCGARACDETTDVCRCASAADCDDGQYCNGVETCHLTMLVCITIPTTCSTGRYCLEGPNRCGVCATAADCSDGQTCNGAEACLPSGACAAPTRCPVDADGDGVRSLETGGTDCDDMDPERWPGHTEVCDAVNRDEDCDPTTFGTRDLDRDGFGDASCCNIDPVTGARAACGTDCDDMRPSTSPIALEACNGIDDDCDGAIDEGVSVGVFRDLDGDGTGDATCGTLRCPGTAGWVSLPNDCDDARSAIREGSSTCDPSGAGVRICMGGGWVSSPCPAGTSCRPQPDGTGLCL